MSSIGQRVVLVFGIQANHCLCPYARPEPPKSRETQPHNARCRHLRSGPLLCLSPVSSQVGGSLEENWETQVLTFGTPFLPGSWALVYNGWTRGHILPGFDTSGNDDLLLPVAPPPPVPFTMPFSVRRQPISPHSGHERDRGVPALQAFRPVFQLQDPGKGLPGAGGVGRTAKGWRESPGAGFLPFPN